MVKGQGESHMILEWGTKIVLKFIVQEDLSNRES